MSATSEMPKITAVLSMLHEPASRPNSATRRFRGEAPLAWALYRLGRSTRISQTTVLCWEDQANEVRAITSEMKAQCAVKSARIPHPHLDSVAASRRWADGWRGGLLAACEFDRGFHGPWIAQIASDAQADAILLVDPSAALVDPLLIDGLVDHLISKPEIDFCFTPAAPGLSGVLLRKGLIEQLAAGGSHPGTMLAYRPDLPMRDPISTASCAPLPTALARTTHRFTLDSERQIDRIAGATVHLNGQLIATESEQLLRLLDASPPDSSLPREVVLEINTRRASRPIYSPLAHIPVERPDLSLDQAKIIFEELAAADDVRIVFGGVGDPLLHPEFLAMVESARDAGIGAIAVETDLLGIEPAAIESLADSAVDIVSVNFPAVSAQIYLDIMGVDGMKSVMENLVRLITRRQSKGRGTPLVAPTFVKTAANLAEMEAWYDHWLRVLGCAVIVGPGDFAGQIPDLSVAKMEPATRRGCQRIKQRMTILSDGQIVSCEQDVLARQPLGRLGTNSIKQAWNGAAAGLRRDHVLGQWRQHAVCATCRDWYRA